MRPLDSRRQPSTAAAARSHTRQVRFAAPKVNWDVPVDMVLAHDALTHLLSPVIHASDSAAKALA